MDSSRTSNVEAIWDIDSALLRKYSLRRTCPKSPILLRAHTIIGTTVTGIVAMIAIVISVVMLPPNLELSREPTT